MKYICKIYLCMCVSIGFLVRINSRTLNFDPTDPINFSSAPLKRNCPNHGNFYASISIRAHNRVQVHRTIPHGLFRRHFALIIQMWACTPPRLSQVTWLLSFRRLHYGTPTDNVREYIWKNQEKLPSGQHSYRIAWQINCTLICYYNVWNHF